METVSSSDTDAEVSEFSYEDLLVAEWVSLMDLLRNCPRVVKTSHLYMMLESATTGLLMTFVQKFVRVLRQQEANGVPIHKSLKDMTSAFGCPDLTGEDIESFQTSLTRLHTIVCAAQS